MMVSLLSSHPRTHLQLVPSVHPSLELWPKKQGMRIHLINILATILVLVHPQMKRKGSAISTRKRLGSCQAHCALLLILLLPQFLHSRPSLQRKVIPQLRSREISRLRINRPKKGRRTSNFQEKAAMSNLPPSYSETRLVLNHHCLQILFHHALLEFPNHLDPHLPLAVHPEGWALLSGRLLVLLQLPLLLLAKLPCPVILMMLLLIPIT